MSDSDDERSRNHPKSRQISLSTIDNEIRISWLVQSQISLGVRVIYLKMAFGSVIRKAGISFFVE
jgi:hypothetical protein